MSEPRLTTCTSYDHGYPSCPYAPGSTYTEIEPFKNRVAVCDCGAERWRFIFEEGRWGPIWGWEHLEREPGRSL